MNKQACFTHSMEQYSAIKRSEILTQVSTWLNLENVVLSERSQIQHATSWMIPFLGSVPKRQIHGDRKQITSDQGLGWRNEEWLLIVGGVLLFGDENALKLVLVLVVQACGYTKAIDLCTLNGRIVWPISMHVCSVVSDCLQPHGL